MARSTCSSCSQTFSSESSFLMHRIGSYGEAIYNDKKQVIAYTQSERRCLTEVEMQAKQMVKNDRGHWTTGEFDASVFGKKEGKHD